MKKLLFIIQTLQTGGAERVCANLANYFAEHGYQVSIALLYHDKKTIYSLHSSIRFIHVPPLRFGLAPAVLAFLLQLFFMRRIPDVVIAFMWHANVFASILAKVSGIRCILSEHSNPEIERHDPNLIRLASRYFHYADKMVVLNTGAFRFMCQKMGLPPERIVTIPNACAKTVPCQTERLLEQPYLLAVGRLVPVKGFDRLIRMFAEIAKLHPEEHLVICGDGRERENLKTLAASLRLSDKIHFQGECQNLAPWYLHADALCFTSHYEGWGNVIMEAMMQGLPVISFDCRYGPAEMISSHRSGILVPQDDESCYIRETAEYLDRLPESRARYSVEAVRSISAFTTEKINPRWEAIVEGKKQELSA